MYVLRDLKNGLYQIHELDGKAYEGTLKPIFQKCVEMGLKPKEIEEAVMDLQTKNHDYAEFGVYKTYIFSAKDDKKKVA